MTHVVIKKVQGDGSCFYHAVTAASDRPHTNFTKLRNMVANVYSTVVKGTNKKLKEQYESLLSYYAGEQNMSPAEYADQTRKCMWAGPLEVEILSKVTKRRIAVYDMNDLKHNARYKCIYNLADVKPIIDFGDKRRTPIMVVIRGYKPLSNKFGTHYDALIPVKFVKKQK